MGISTEYRVVMCYVGPVSCTVKLIYYLGNQRTTLIESSGLSRSLIDSRSL